MDKHHISELMETVMGKLHDMVDVSTVIGESITTPDGITIIPVSKVSFGFASGGSDFNSKQTGSQNNLPFGGGAGAGVKINPVAFVVIKDGNVRVLNIDAPASTAVDRIIENAPDIIDKITDLLKKEQPENA